MEHRKQIRHFNDPGHAHFLTFSCHQRRPYLSKQRCRDWLRDAISRACESHGFFLWAFVFMPEHVHLLVYPRTPKYDMAGFLKSVKQPVARKARAWLEANEASRVEEFILRRGSRDVFCFWQPGPGCDRNIHSEKELREKLQYIHNNPVTRGLVERPEDWLWSSAARYAGLAAGPLVVDLVALSW